MSIRARRVHARDVDSKFLQGDAVVVSTKDDQRVGLVFDVTVGGRVITVQFGADGPFNKYWRRAVRHATRDEVKAAGLEGVGGLGVRR